MTQNLGDGQAAQLIKGYYRYSVQAWIAGKATTGLRRAIWIDLAASLVGAASVRSIAIVVGSAMIALIGTYRGIWIVGARVGVAYIF